MEYWGFASYDELLSYYHPDAKELWKDSCIEFQIMVESEIEKKI